MNLMRRCDDCQSSPIVGRMYTCTVCEDFDLCERCHLRIVQERKNSIPHALGLHKAFHPVTIHTTSAVQAPGTLALLPGQYICHGFEENLCLTTDPEEKKRIQKSICPICSLVSTTGVKTICKHFFCKECITKHITYNEQCPLCRHQLRGLGVAFMEPDSKSRTAVKALDIRCPHSTLHCDWKGKQEKLQTHLQVCAYQPCTYQEFGCAMVGNMDTLSKHYNEPRAMHKHITDLHNVVKSNHQRITDAEKNIRNVHQHLHMMNIMVRALQEEVRAARSSEMVVLPDEDHDEDVMDEEEDEPPTPDFFDFGQEEEVMFSSSSSSSSPTLPGTPIDPAETGVSPVSPELPSEEGSPADY